MWPSSAHTLLNVSRCLSQALGGLACQCFHQRTLSASSLTTAKVTCFVAGLIYPVFGLPSILIGAAAASVGE